MTSEHDLEQLIAAASWLEVYVAFRVLHCSVFRIETFVISDYRFVLWTYLVILEVHYLFARLTVW